MKSIISKQLLLFQSFAIVTLVVLALVQQLLAAEHTEREWESSGGKFKITGTFKEYHADKDEIVLVKKDGKEVTVPLAKLSDADREYVKKISAQKPDKKNDNNKPGTPRPDSDEGLKPLSVEDEKLAMQLVEELKIQYRPSPSPQWTKVWTVPIEGFAASVNFSRSPDYVALVTNNGVTQVRNMSDGSLVKSAEQKLLGKANRVIISDDAKYVMSATRQKGIVYWDFESGTKIFGRTDPKARFRNAGLAIQNGKAMFLDVDLNLHTYPEVGGEETIVAKDDFIRTQDKFGPKEGTDAAEKAEEDEKDDDEKASTKKHYGTNRFVDISISPDSKKYVIWRYRSNQFKFVNLDYQSQKKARSSLYINTTTAAPDSTRKVQIAGAIATNDNYAYLLDNGSLHCYSNELTQEDSQPAGLFYQTPMIFQSVRSLHSWDGKYGAMSAQDKILVFPAANPGEWAMVGGPQGNHDDTYLHPDMMRIISSDNERNLILWKAGNPDYLKNIGNTQLLAKLLSDKKFNIVDRAYVILESDTEAKKYSLMNPWTDKFMSSVKTQLQRQEVAGDRETYANIRKWHQANPQNNIGYIFWADVYVDQAWKARGGGYANQVKPESWTIFNKRIAMAKSVLKPMMSRKYIPSEAIKIWLRVCQADGWKEDEVALGIVPMMRDFPLDCGIHANIAWSLLPQWYGREGDSEKYCKKIADMVDPKYGDAVYAVACKRLIMREEYFNDPDAIFNPAQPYNKTFGNAVLDWNRIREGIKQLIQLFPDDSEAVSLALFLSVVESNRELAEKCMKVIDEKHNGIVGGHLYYYEIMQIKKALKK